MTFLRRHPWAVLVTLALLAGATWLVWSVRRNAARKLTLQRLETSRDLWDKKGPKSYRLTYAIHRGGAADADEYQVDVKDGAAVAASVNGRAVEAGRLGNYGMNRLFDFLERFFKVDAERSAEKANYLADFDSADGHLIWYYRHVPGTRESVTIEVRGLD